MKLIDADKLIEKLSANLDNPEEFPVISLGTILRMIDNEPEVVAHPEQKWIPCSERLPDVAQRVLLSGHGMVMIGMLHSFGKYSLEPTGISYVYPKDDIEAWMPMPEPYQGKERGEGE